MRVKEQKQSLTLKVDGILLLLDEAAHGLAAQEVIVDVFNALKQPRAVILDHLHVRVAVIETIEQIDVVPAAHPFMHAHHVEIAGTDKKIRRLAGGKVMPDVGERGKFFLDFHFSTCFKNVSLNTLKPSSKLKPWISLTLMCWKKHKISNVMICPGTSTGKPGG